MEPAFYNLSLISAAREVKDIIDQDLSRHLKVKELARMVGINECSLKQRFKHFFKVTIYQYLLSKRMDYARQLIEGTDLPVKEIAFCCGYESPAGFITSFRRYFGISPGVLRKEFRKKVRV